MSLLSDQSETTRRAQDAGRVNSAWHWFSNATIRAADSYRDVRWRRIGLHLGAALLLMAASRIEPGWALAPWMFIAAAIWLLYGLRVAGLKALGRVMRKRERDREGDPGA